MSSGVQGWIIDAQERASTVLSAAAQCPDANTLAVLESIPTEAWGCSPELGDLSRMLMVGIKGDIAESSAAFVLAEIGTEADPWRLSEYADGFTKLWRAFHNSTTTLPRDPLLGLVEEDEVPTGKASALPPFDDLSGWWDLGDIPLPHVFVEHLPCGEMGILGGEPGTGKTHLAIGLALSVAFGRAFVAGFTPSRRGRVALYLGEDSQHPTAQRVKSWCEVHGISRVEFEAAVVDGRLSFHCGSSADLLDFSQGQGRRTAAHVELLELCRIGRYDLVVVDSLLQWSGVSSENDNSQMHLAGLALVELARALETGAVLALAHSNKSSDKSGEVGLHSIRGGGAIAGKCRWAAILQHLPDKVAESFGIHETERRRYARLNFTKNQYAAGDTAPIHLERGQGGVLTAVRLLPPKPEDKLLALAVVMADKLGDNSADIPKWDLIQKKPGANFRAEVKVYFGSAATIRNIGLAYEVAVERGLIIEETGKAAVHGQAAIIPRRGVVEESEYAA